MNAAQAYRNRCHAGQVLANAVREELGRRDAVVLALPRGGVPVGLEVARVMEAPLDVFVVRKLGVPGQPELAMGAIASGGYEVLNRALIADLGLTELEIAAVADQEATELVRREWAYRSDRPPVDVRGRTAILVDDGLATGFTMRAAIAAIRERNISSLVVAVPVGAIETCEDLAHEVDTLICPLQPEDFHAVGMWYEDFTPTTDDDVRECLAAAAALAHHVQSADHGGR
jgi:putative phosphoribosyl transferase